MKLWRMLKERMLSHADSIAFTDGNITYRRLVEMVEGDQTGEGHIRIVCGKSKQDAALQILYCLANGYVSVPVDEEYGSAYVESVRAFLRDDEATYPDLAFIVFTSGTTGTPKGVMLSEDAIIENLKAIEGYFAVRAGQKMTIMRPLVHISALTGELLFGLYQGLELSFSEGSFQPQKAAQIFRENGTEVIGCTPTVLYHLYRYLADTSLTDIVISGERISSGLVAMLKPLGDKIHFYNVYGLTENSPRVTALCPQDFFRKIGSVGKVIRNTQLKMKDGELLVQSGSLMTGYYRRAELTNKKLRDGWLYTGDLAEIDKDGFVYILGRKDGMIIRGGVNVFPEDIESEAKSIEGVSACIAYGEDDLRFGQRVCLNYTGTANADMVHRKLAERLPSRMVPSKVRQVKSIATTASGKIKRK